MPAPLLHMRITKPITSSTCVLYARVSSKDQEQEGFSIPSQLRLLREYANKNGLRILHEYIDVETARRAGREQFGTMVEYLKKHQKSCTTIIVGLVNRFV